MARVDEHDGFERHRAALARVADCPLRPGNTVTLLPGGAEALQAMADAIDAAATSIVLEFYTFEDVVLAGRSLSDRLLDRLRAGVRVALIYDAIGSDDTPSAMFESLRRAGAHIMPFRAFNPLRRFFSLRINDRDHRKILVVDGRVAFIGGVNIDRQYLNPPEAGIPPDHDTKKAFWRDAAARITGPVVADAQALFAHTWQRHGGDTLPPWPYPAASPAPDGEWVCIEGSAPREGRPLHTRALAAAIEAAHQSVWIVSGYFVPMADEMRMLQRAASRGVDVRLILPGVSDVPSAVHAARATYGKLIKAGLHVHEMHGAVLHAKLSTVDGVWTSIGSSNFDRRSAVMNNEVDAVILGTRTADRVGAMLREWMASSPAITLAEWRNRSRHERLGEIAALAWRRFM